MGGRISFWPARSFSGGSGLACAVVPPAHPPTGNRGTRCTPGGGCGLRTPPSLPPSGGRISFWPARSFSGGAGLACAVVPPAHPPTFLETGGLPLYPRRGLRPLHPAWGRRGASFAYLGGPGTPILTFPRVQGQGQSSPLHLAWGTEGERILTLLIAEGDDC